MASLMVALKGSRQAGFSARKVIPKDVREAYTRLYGVAWEAKLSIPPGLSAHEAKAQCGEWLAEIETRIGRLRAATRGEGQPLTRRNAHALAGRWYSWFIRQQENDVRTPKYWRDLSDHLVWDVIYPHAPDEHYENPGADKHWEWQADPEVRAAIRPVMAEFARTASFLLEEGLVLTSDANILFLDAVQDNLLPALQRLEAVARGDFSPDETLDHFPVYSEALKQPSPILKCWALFQAWIAAVQPSPSTAARWTVVFKAVDERFSDATQIDQQDARAWMNGLPNERRSSHTVATVWRTALKTVFTWGVNEKLVRTNPFKEIKISVPKKVTERETKAFSPSEAQTILRAALSYTQPKTPDERARRWVPWICAYTGARAGEITQLRGQDVSERDGRFFAKLSPSAGKIKTRNARTVPLHEHLIEQGFGEFVTQMGNGPLFYQKPKETAKSQSSAGTPVQSPPERTRSRLGEWVRSLGITDPELSPTHAWRHTFKAQAARSGIDERYSDAITGHAPATAGRAYGKPTSDDLAEAMRKFPRYSV
jgi:integrase